MKYIKLNNKLESFFERNIYTNAFVYSAMKKPETKYYAYENNGEVIACLVLIKPYLQFSAIKNLPEEVAQNFINTIKYLKDNEDYLGEFTTDETSYKYLTSDAKLENYMITCCYLLYLNNSENLVETSGFNIKHLNEDKINCYLKLQQEVFDRPSSSAEQYDFIKNFIEKHPLPYIESDNKLISVGCYSEPNKVSVITAIATSADFRNKGYASAITSYICKIILENGATPVLFYTNPKAGKIYRRLGFIELQNNYIMCKPIN